MGLLKLLALLLFDPRRLNEINLRSPRAGEPNQPDNTYIAVPDNLNREVLYESFIPVDALIFILETSSLSRSAYEDLIRKTVIEVKGLLCADFANFHLLDNYALKPETRNRRLRAALETRNKYLENDKSLIAKGLVMEKYRQLAERVRNTEFVPKRDSDERYSQMMERLYDVMYADDGIYVAIQREKREFYRDNADVMPKEALDARTSLSLGGSVFMPGLLAAVLKSLNVAGKAEMIARALGDILAPIEELHSLAMHKSCTERRDLILSFLNSCLYRRTDVFKEKIDRGYETRSRILGLYLRGADDVAGKLQLLDELQENEIRRLINLYENMREKDLYLRVDKAVVEAYSRWLDDGQRESERRLRKLFGKG
jgi:hypothetical protein